MSTDNENQRLLRMMKIKVLKDQPMSLIRAVDHLKDGKCIGIMPDNYETAYVELKDRSLTWNNGEKTIGLIQITRTWYPVVKVPETVMVKISAEETEMLFHALNVLNDTSEIVFTGVEWNLLRQLADRANNAFEKSPK